MPKPIEGRITAIERVFNAPPGSHLEYSHGQIVEVVELTHQGVEESEAWERVGPPQDAIPPGGKSHAQLVLEAAGLLWSPGAARKPEADAAASSPSRAADQGGRGNGGVSK